jgi:hypothetical protein
LGLRSLRGGRLIERAFAVAVFRHRSPVALRQTQHGKSDFKQRFLSNKSPPPQKKNFYFPVMTGFLPV